MTLIQKIITKFKAKVVYTESEILVKTLVEKLLDNSDTKYRVAPLSGDVVLQESTVGYQVVITGNRICWHDGSSTIDRSFPLTFAEEIKSMVFDKIEKDRQEATAEIFDSEKNILNNMITKLQSNGVEDAFSIARVKL